MTHILAMPEDLEDASLMPTNEQKEKRHKERELRAQSRQAEQQFRAWLPRCVEHVRLEGWRWRRIARIERARETAHIEEVLTRR